MRVYELFYRRVNLIAFAATLPGWLARPEGPLQVGRQHYPR